MATVSRPNTVTFRLDYVERSTKVSYEHVWEAIAENFGMQKVICVQPTGNQAFLLTFRSPSDALLAIDTGLKIDNVCVPILPVSGGLLWVKVTGVPWEVSDEALKTVLQFYGVVRQIVRVRADSPLGEFYTGDRRVLVLMKRRVPNLLTVLGFEVTCWYRDVVKLCRRCGGGGHVASDCDRGQVRAKRCEICGNRWHVTAECQGCATCGTDSHPPDACPVRRVSIQEGEGDPRGDVEMPEVVSRLEDSSVVVVSGVASGTVSQPSGPVVGVVSPAPSVVVEQVPISVGSGGVVSRGPREVDSRFSGLVVGGGSPVVGGGSPVVGGGSPVVGGGGPVVSVGISGPRVLRDRVKIAPGLVTSVHTAMDHSEGLSPETSPSAPPVRRQ